MKSSKIALILCLLIGGYSAFWYSMSNKLEEKFKSHIDQLALNESGSYHFKYEGIERGGYPLGFSFALKNPTIKVNSSEDQSVQPSEIKVDGKIIDYFSLSGKLKSIDYVGKTDILIPQEGKQDPLHFLVDGNMSLESESGNLMPLIVFKNMANLDEVIADAWTNLDLDNSVMKFSNVKIFDLKRNIPVTSFQSSYVQFDRKQKEDLNQKIRIKGNIKGFDSSTLFKYDNRYQDMFGEAQQLYITFFETLYKKIGPMNFDFDSDFDIPNKEEWRKIFSYSFFENVMNPFPPISASFEETTSNPTANSDFNAKLITKHEENGNNFLSFKMDGDSKTTPKLVEALTSALQETSKAAAQWEPSEEQGKNIKKLFVEHYDTLAALIPHLDKFGKIEHFFNLDLNYNKAQMTGKIKLEKLGFHTSLYGFQVDGVGGGGMNDLYGLLSFELLNHELMFREIVGYANKVIKVINLANQANKNAEIKEIPDIMVQHFLVYLREISNDPKNDSKDVHITFSYLKNEKKYVGTLSLEEFNQKTTAFITEMEKEYKSIE